MNLQQKARRERVQRVRSFLEPDTTVRDLTTKWHLGGSNLVLVVTAIHLFLHSCPGCVPDPTLDVTSPRGGTAIY